MKSVELAVVAYSLHRLAKLDCVWRVAGVLGFGCGATFAARNLGIEVTGTAAGEWAVGGLLAAGILFQREIIGYLRRGGSRGWRSAT